MNKIAMTYHNPKGTHFAEPSLDIFPYANKYIYEHTLKSSLSSLLSPIPYFPF